MENENVDLTNIENIGLTNVENVGLTKEKKYDLDDLLDVWYRACFNGATYWQNCQERGVTLPDTFNLAMNAMREELKKDPTGEALKLILSNNMALLGTLQELEKSSKN